MLKRKKFTSQEKKALPESNTNISSSGGRKQSRLVIFINGCGKERKGKRASHQEEHARNRERKEERSFWRTIEEI